MIPTPASGIVRANPELQCAHCKQSLRNLAVYPITGAHWRCVNRQCSACCLPRGDGGGFVHASIFCLTEPLNATQQGCDQ